MIALQGSSLVLDLSPWSVFSPGPDCRVAQLYFDLMAGLIKSRRTDGALNNATQSAIWGAPKHVVAFASCSAKY